AVQVVIAAERAAGGPGQHRGGAQPGGEPRCQGGGGARPGDEGGPLQQGDRLAAVVLAGPRLLVADRGTPAEGGVGDAGGHRGESARGSGGEDGGERCTGHGSASGRACGGGRRLGRGAEGLGVG